MGEGLGEWADGFGLISYGYYVSLKLVLSSQPWVLYRISYHETLDDDQQIPSLTRRWLVVLCGSPGHHLLQTYRTEGKEVLFHLV